MSSIDYGNLMHEAMRGLIQKVLTDVSKDGLPGAHHFLITFVTDHPEVELADWLRERFPDEMTIVMQHWFDDLRVTDTGFHVTLNFGDQPEPMFIPFNAIHTFADPSVEFGLRFEAREEAEENLPHLVEEEPEIDADPDGPLVEPDAPHKDAEVVSLDSFRK
ncbi:MAG: hypothetical protein CR993_02730 [Rhodobacterales bacterium]|nr:MAG: hypothetical protein CR993_02730 [Rhodobacterales bacterium]